MSLRQIINAILYILKTGCQWRQLPREFPDLTAVYYYFSVWSHDSTWARVHHLLRSRLREKGGRHKHPTAGCLDSQSVKCTAVPGRLCSELPGLCKMGSNARTGYEFHDLFRWQGFTNQIALYHVTLQKAQCFQLLLSLHPFGDHFQAETMT